MLLTLSFEFGVLHGLRDRQGPESSLVLLETPVPLNCRTLDSNATALNSQCQLASSNARVAPKGGVRVWLRKLLVFN